MANKYEKVIFDITELLKGKNSDLCFCKKRIAPIKEQLKECEQKRG